MGKRIILIGKTGSGKTTLIQRMESGVFCRDKTQMIAYHDSFIDTPGEYLELRSMYRALVVTAADADAIGMIQACDDNEFRLPPQLASIFPKETVGIVSKIDLARSRQDIEQARAILDAAGAVRVFELSALSGEGIDAFMEYMREMI
jgi:ethanolamine utilization protein EutP